MHVRGRRLRKRLKEIFEQFGLKVTDPPRERLPLAHKKERPEKSIAATAKRLVHGH